jgi:tetratricopeptide (TPR) repeat protein
VSIQRLETDGDWARVVRSWLVNSLHPPILERAIAILNASSAECRWYGDVAQHLSRLDPTTAISSEPVPEQVLAQCSTSERLTLSLLALFPQVTACHLAEHAHSVFRPGMLANGLRAAEQAIELAKALEDLDVMEFCCDAAAHALLTLGRAAEARDRMVEAVEACRELCRRDAMAHGVLLSVAAENLGRIYKQLGDPDARCSCLMESVSALAPLAESQPLRYGRQFLKCLSTLGVQQFDLNRPTEACETFERACQYARGLAELDAEHYRAAYQQSLYDVSWIYVRLERYPLAHARLMEATASMNSAAESPGDTDAQEREGKIYNILGLVLEKLERLPEASEALRQALLIRRELYRRNAESFHDDLSMTLHNLARIEGRVGGVRTAAATQAEIWELEREWGDPKAPFGRTAPSAGQESPAWVVRLRKFITLRNLRDLRAAIEACPEVEIRGLLEHPGVMMGLSPEIDMQELVNRLRSQGRMAESVALSCLSALTELTRAHFREQGSILRTRGMDTTQLINIVAVCEAIGFHESAAYMLFSLGKYLAQRGEWSQAERYLRRAWAVIQRIPESEGREFAGLSASILNSLGTTLADLRGYQEAESLLALSIEIRRERQSMDDWVEAEFLANALSNFSGVAEARGKTALARRSIEEALEIYRRLSKEHDGSSRPLEARSLNRLGGLAQGDGETKVAEEAFREASEILRELDAGEAHLAGKDLPTGAYRADLASSLLNWAGAIKERGQTESAAKLFEESLALFDRMPSESGYGAAAHHVRALTSYGSLLSELGEREKALEAYRRSVLLAETQEKSGVERHLFKGPAAAAYAHILYDDLRSKRYPAVFRCLAALREGGFTALAGPQAGDFDAAIQVLSEKQEELGRAIRILIAQRLPGDRVLLALMAADRELECHVSRSLVPAARKLFAAVDAALRPAPAGQERRAVEIIKELGREAWSCLPESIRETLSPAFAGDVLISADQGWATFPWEGLYDQDGNWAGLMRPLSRWTAISANGLRRLRRSTFGDGWQVAAVVCPWDAVSHLMLPTARAEAERVSEALVGMGYHLVGGCAILGRAATKAAMFDAIRQQPSVIHYAGHGAVRNEEEVLVLADGAGTGWDYCGTADFALHKDQLRIRDRLLAYGPLVVLNSCYAGTVRGFGGKQEGLVSLLLEEGAEGVVACPFPVDDSIGSLFGAALYRTGGSTMADRFMGSRREVAKDLAERDPGAWPLWMLFHYHGNPYAVLPE